MASLIDPALMYQAMIQRSMPLTLNTGMGQAMPPAQPQPEAGMFQRAGALRAGTPAMGQPTPQRGQPSAAGPMGNSISKYKTMMLMAAGLDDSEKARYNEAAQDPSISPQALKQLLELHHQAKAARPAVTQADFAGPQQQPGMTVASHASPTGQETVPQGGGSMHTMGGNQFIMPHAQPQAQHPAAAMLGQLKAAGIPDTTLEMYKQSMLAGTPIQQVMAHAQQLLQQQAMGQQRQQEHQQERQETRAERQEDQQTARTEHRQDHDRDLQIRQLQHQQTMASQMGDEPQVQAIQQKIDGMLKPQPQQSQAAKPQQSQQAAPTHTATGPNGQKLGLVNGKWVPLNG